MKPRLKVRFKSGLVAALLLGSVLLPMSPALAETETVSLERLRVQDVILLPTVSSAYVAHFTRPKTWQVSGSSQVVVQFQHSHELLPNRSWLEVDVNGRRLAHVPLTHANENGTTLTLPMPVSALKDFNTLRFVVEQHYTDHCEDPLDKSLWTQILPPTKIVFNYTPTVPEVNLAAYPYPVVDELTYSPARVRFITAKSVGVPELQAMALVNAHLAQQAQDHELMTRVTFDDAGISPAQEHLAYVGTAANISEAAKYQAAFGNLSLQNGQWVDRATNQPLADDQGVLLFFPAPGVKERAVLIVSGNSERAVQKAAEFLTTRPQSQDLTGRAFVTPPGWNVGSGRDTRPPKFIENQTRTFSELGFDTQEVHKINAPPIVYQVPVVADFRRAQGRLWLDVHYSYSPELNPEFSSLELRMNDVSIGNIPLTNPQGETGKTASIPISNELIRVRNNLVAQFHLEPDKHGWCVDNYVDNAWGKILDDSKFRVEGGPGSRLPDVGLLNGTMFPYSTDDTLSNVHLVVPKEPTAAQLDAMLGFITRLGRATMAEAPLRLTVGKGMDGAPGDRHLAVFRAPSDLLKLPERAYLSWQSDSSGWWQKLGLADLGGAKMESVQAELGKGLYLEQFMNGSRAVSVFTASDPAGFLRLGELLETDKDFARLDEGFVQQASLLNRDALNALNPLAIHQERAGGGPFSGWFAWLNAPFGWLARWLTGLPWSQILLAVAVVFGLLVVLPALARSLFRR